MANKVPADWTADSPPDPQVILSVEQARRELDVPDGVDINSELIPQINEAAAWVGNAISAPVLDTEYVDTLAPQPLGKSVGSGASRRPWRLMPITIYDRRWVREVRLVEYWDTDGDLAAEPNRSIQPSNLGRVEIADPGPFQDTLQVFPRSAGWPTTEVTLSGSVLRIHSVAGLDMTSSYADVIRRAVVAGVQQLNGGYPAVRHNSTFEKLLMELKPVAA